MIDKVWISMFGILMRNIYTGLIKKMVQYVQREVLANLCSEQVEPNLGTLLVEVVASVLDNEVSTTYKTSELNHKSYERNEMYWPKNHIRLH
jgi:hypothetical protein